MKTGYRSSLIRILEDVLKIGTVFILAMSVVIALIAAADKSSLGEASTGSFETKSFNEGWSLTREDGSIMEILLPVTLEADSGEEIVISNTLPDDLSDGMSLMARASMEDMYVYIDGVLREQYASDSIEGMSYYIPSAYVVIPLDASDSGKEIRIIIRVKTRGVINGVTIGNGNNVWFDVIKKGLAVNLVAVIALIMGLLLTVAVPFIRKSFRTDTTRYLGLLMIDVGLWVLSESTLRQFIFSRPSLSQYFSYFLVELIGAFTCMYFDEVQHRIYHRRYLLMESLVLLQLIVNILLHVSGACALYRTLLLSHLWTALSAVIAIVCIVTDIITKRIKTYRITAIGMTCFVVLSLIELGAFYVSRFHVFGVYICIGLIILMIFTVMQALLDQITAFELQEKNQTVMTINTIETIASAIDARDEYTGGHSERVGLYAERLAREMAADYDLTEEDILRVHYIGLVHDIGKIGVADSVLNKSGRLTDEEFSLMKKHAGIGYEIMSSLGGSIEGLLDGIRYHHERFDGKGYPDGLSDTDIPLIARILALADSYDAMTSNSVYRKRLTDEEVRNEFLRCSGTQFDPALTEIFVRLIDRGELAANTVEGIAADEEGRIRTSSLLENKLQKDLLDKKKISHPSHVRMLCYIIKLMEQKGKDYKVLFIGAENDDEDSINAIREALRGQTERHDVNIEYTKTQNVVALYDAGDDEVDAYIEGVKALRPMLSVEVLRA